MPDDNAVVLPPGTTYLVLDRERRTVLAVVGSDGAWHRLSESTTARYLFGVDERDQSGEKSVETNGTM